MRLLSLWTTTNTATTSTISFFQPLRLCSPTASGRVGRQLLGGVTIVHMGERRIVDRTGGRHRRRAMVAAAVPEAVAAR